MVCTRVFPAILSLGIMRSLTKVVLACVLLFVAEAFGQSYPSKPIRLIVPFPPGGTTDIVARIVGQKLSETWGGQVIIDNRGGGGGVIGTETAARSAPDGYTLMLSTAAGIIVNPLLHGKVSYDPLQDFVPVSLLLLTAQLMVVNASVPANSAKELVALAKAQPGKLNYGSSGNGAANHICMELFKSMTGTNIVHIPYKGAGPAITDLLGGQVQVMFNPMSAFLPHMKTGKLKALGVSSAHRSLAAPDIPTIQESGVPGYEYVLWYGLFAPAKTDRTLVTKLSAHIARILEDPQVAQRLLAQGAEPQGSTPEAFAKSMRDETERVRSIIRSAGIKVE